MSALLVIPPMVKYDLGPLAGPAYLHGAARAAGHELNVLDLNALWIRSQLPSTDGADAHVGSIVGDHAQTRRGLRTLQDYWFDLLSDQLDFATISGCRSPDDLSAMRLTHGQARVAAETLAHSVLGDLWRRHAPSRRPDFVGFSVMCSQQVVTALALSLAARKQWSDVPVIWGGAHVTALAPEIALDERYGWAADGFVAGYAEATFIQMLTGRPLLAKGVFTAGGGFQGKAIEAHSTPYFAGLSQYRHLPLTLPCQTSRGCAYGRCSFCTYPAVEGRYRELDLEALDFVVREARQHGAVLSLKDAFVTPHRLVEVGDRIAGRCHWSASTRLTPELDRELLHRLADQGLRTLELGVESLDAQTLESMSKHQSTELVRAVLEAASGAQVHLVLNVMFGFPGQSLEGALSERDQFTDQLPGEFPNTLLSVESNLLQVQRRAPLGRTPKRFGIGTRTRWPWSSIIDWNRPNWCEENANLFTGHALPRRRIA